MKQGSSGLTLRDLTPGLTPAVEPIPKQVNLWVNQLPAANLAESSRSIYRLLVDINQVILDPARRLEILLILEPVARQLSDSLEGQFVNNHISLSKKQRQIAALVQAIQTELSLGYHAVIEALIGGDLKRSQKKVLAQALLYAVKYHGLIVLRCYQLYANVPPRIWREIYILYSLAQSYELEKLEFENVVSQRKINVKDFFVQILLLSVANPYQLRQAEIEMLWRMLPDYVRFCSLEKHAYNNQHFIIALDSSRPPIQKSLYKTGKDSKLLKLSVSGLLENLKGTLTSVDDQAKYSARKLMVLKHFIQCLNQDTQRSFARTGCLEQTKVTIGLGATHYLLTESFENRKQKVQADQEDGLPLDGNSLELMEGSLRDVTLSVVAERVEQTSKLDRNYLSTSAIANNDVWAKLYRPEQAIESKESPENIKKRSKETIVRESYKIQTCDLVNISPGGYCIEIAASELPKHAQTGEVLGFIEGDDIDNSHWSIGVVRWVKRIVKSESIQMGVQLLAPDAEPVYIRQRNSKGNKNEQQRALMLPALTGVGQSASIITNPLSFSVNTKAQVNEIDSRYDIRLTKEISFSSSFRQFCFDVLGDNSKTVSRPVNSLREDEDSQDGVWDLI